MEGRRQGGGGFKQKFEVYIFHRSLATCGAFLPGRMWRGSSGYNSSAQAAITKYHRPGDLNNKHLFSYSSGS
jgi:hypothetical protein